MKTSGSQCQELSPNPAQTTHPQQPRPRRKQAIEGVRLGVRLSALLGAVTALAAVGVAPVYGQLSPADITALQERAKKESWTFTVKENPATRRPLAELCGMVEPANWRATAKFATLPAVAAPNTLPAAFDWRAQTNGASPGLPPIRNQGGCGSCWAFATVGALECAIRIKDGVDVDLSEQWLVSCNQSGWSCAGGWYAHDYHLRNGSTDSCLGNGAVPESNDPYQGVDAACGCPYPHQYWIDSWAYSGDSVDQIKQAILTHGPVSVSLAVDSAFEAYGGGIFNACSASTINHSVVLVGWDDTQGSGGVWILRNSWGPSWGEGGYMRIAYGCDSVGYSTCFINYAGSAVSPSTGFTSSGTVGGPFSPASMSYALTNQTAGATSWMVTRTQSWLDVNPSSVILAPNKGTNVIVSIDSTANTLSAGNYTDTVTFTNLTSGTGITRPVSLTVNPPRIYYFPLDSDPGWSRQGEWAFGKPNGLGGTTHGNPDPTGGATGTNVFGVNLGGDYSTTVGGPYYLTAGPLSFVGYTNVLFQFQRWLNTDYQPYVSATVEVSTNGTTWTQIFSNGSSEIADASWSKFQYSLSALADNCPTVYARWGYQVAGGAWAYSGWNIDDVQFLGSPVVTSFQQWQMQYFNCTACPQADANADPDGDGMSNTNEFLSGTVPTNSASVLRIVALARIGGDVRVNFTSVNGKYYLLERCDSLGGAWTRIADNIPGTDNIRQAIDVGGAGRTSAFYRVRLNQSPNPALADSDGDGIPDWWMLAYFGHATGLESDHSCAGNDCDGDGLSNLQEYLSGTNPTNSASAFRILAVAREGSDLRVTWFTAGGHTNVVQATPDLGASYSDISSNVLIAGGSDTTTNYLDVGGATNWPVRFYRARLVP